MQKRWRSSACAGVCLVHSREVIIGQHDVGRLAGHLRSSQTHGDSNVGLTNGRGIVDWRREQIKQEQTDKSERTLHLQRADCARRARAMPTLLYYLIAFSPPSPVMAATSPRRCSDLTSFSLLSGDTREKTTGNGLRAAEQKTRDNNSTEKDREKVSKPICRADLVQTIVGREPVLVLARACVLH